MSVSASADTQLTVRTLSAAEKNVTNLECPPLPLVVALAVVGPERLIAQIEGERGIMPVASSSDIAITGIQVETTGKSPEDARLNGWREAQKQAWAKAGGPAMDIGCATP